MRDLFFYVMMGSFSGIIQRPFTAAAAAAAVAALSSDFPDKFPHPRCSDSNFLVKQTSANSPYPEVESKSWLSWISFSRSSDLSVAINSPILNSKFPSTRFLDYKLSSSSFASPSVLFSLYQSANLTPGSKVKPSQVNRFATPPSEFLHEWHRPKPDSQGVTENSGCLSAKAHTVVVLLGWLGAKQKHLKKYAEWYTSRGFHVVTFTYPMSDVISYKAGGKAEQQLGLLVNDLAGWVGDDHKKSLVFHTFSNTGWLTYGVILEQFQNQDPSLTGMIKGCIVDSAPVAAPDPQVWASGFSAALLKKQSVATKGSLSSNGSNMEMLVDANSIVEAKPAVTEVALLAVLEKLFEVVLNLPTINRRLSDVLGLLSSNQPKCPQLYIYSTADRVIPAKSVESFIEEQRRAGHDVRACNFVNSPHVDHFRNNPNLYTSQLTTFLEDHVLSCCRDA